MRTWSTDISGDWALPPVGSLAPDLWSIPLPSPATNPLRYVTVYVLGSDSGLTLVDAGWDTNEAWDGRRAEVAATVGTVRRVHAHRGG
jgi:hypothetical protein